jgi:hypothetical protein
VAPRRRQGLADRFSALFFWRAFVCTGCRRRFRCFVAPFGIVEQER